MVLRVVIDRPDPGTQKSATSAASGTGDGQAIDAEATRVSADDSIGVADCQHVSQDLSALLDVEEDELGETALTQAYTLEVSSPGLDRPLRHEADYRRFTGRLAKVVTTAPIDGQSAFSGRIVAVEDGAVILEEGSRRHRVPVALIKRGQLAVEF